MVFWGATDNLVKIFCKFYLEFKAACPGLNAYTVVTDDDVISIGYKKVEISSTTIRRYEHQEVSG